MLHVHAEETSLRPQRFGTAYHLSARLRLDHPVSGTPDCSALLLFDSDADGQSGYAVRLRELTGVPYVALVRIDTHGEHVLSEVLHGLTLGSFHGIGVHVDGPRVVVSVDGGPVLDVIDPGRVQGSHLGLAARRTTAAVGEIVVEPTQPTETATSRRVSDPHPPSEGRAGPPTVIESEWFRLELTSTEWVDGREFRLALSARRPDGWSPAAALGQIWLVSGHQTQARDVWSTSDLSRVVPERIVSTDPNDIRLEASAEGFRDVELRVDLARPHPVIEVTAVPLAAARVCVVVLGFAGRKLETVSEVVCGPLQHARMVRGVSLLPANEMTTPFAIVEGRSEPPLTWGVGVPAEDLAFDDEQNRDPEDQPFALSLRDRDSAVRPTVCLPAPGRRSERAADEAFTERVLLILGEDRLYDTVTQLLRVEYAYRAYRVPVSGVSLTDTVLNLINLVALDGGDDDTVDYVASPSGWWSRAKGFIDVENLETVRSTTAGVLLSAAYLRDDPDLYDRRARPTVEFHLSRNGYGWTPVSGRRVYGDASRDQLCSTPVGMSALAPLHEMTGRRNPGIAALAEESPGVTSDYWRQRGPFMDALHAYRLTGSPDRLDEACRLADRYVAQYIDGPGTDLVDPHDFSVFYVADWVGLLELYLETSDPAYLSAAAQEARRFVTATFVRPVPSGDTELPNRPTVHNREVELGRWWGPERLYRYPREELPVEPTPAWAASITGMGFEAVTTLRGSGPTMNPGWAAALLRLAHLTDDTLLADVAHNSIIGRFGSYPGYYYRQQNVAVTHPDYPLLGPFDASTLYHHHAPGQLGLALDYLMTEHEVRSGGEVVFPAAFEENFVWFRYRTYGHRPGRFHGVDDVWLWMPEDVVRVDNPAVSWISGEQDRTTFVVSLVNSTGTDQNAQLTVGDRVGVPARCLGVRYDGLHRQEVVVTQGTLDVTLPPWGHVGVVLRDVGPITPRLRCASSGATGGERAYSFNDDTDVGAVRGVLLERPDGSGHDAYIQSTAGTPAALRYSVDGGVTWTTLAKAVHPAEWTVRVPPRSAIRYRLTNADGTTDEMEMEG